MQRCWSNGATESLPSDVAPYFGEEHSCEVGLNVESRFGDLKVIQVQPEVVVPWRAFPFPETNHRMFALKQHKVKHR